MEEWVKILINCAMGHLSGKFIVGRRGTYFEEYIVVMHEVDERERDLLRYGYYLLGGEHGGMAV